jgi:serine/threonine-protein kinase RIO1
VLENWHGKRHTLLPQFLHFLPSKELQKFWQNYARHISIPSPITVLTSALIIPFILLEPSRSSKVLARTLHDVANHARLRTRLIADVA